METLRKVTIKYLNNFNNLHINSFCIINSEKRNPHKTPHSLDLVCW